MPALLQGGGLTDLAEAQAARYRRSTRRPEPAGAQVSAARNRYSLKRGEGTCEPAAVPSPTAPTGQVMTLCMVLGMVLGDVPARASTRER